MAGRLEGKVCVITGAASGIGAESALTSTPATFAPSAMKSRADSAPIPLAAPVITQTMPSRRPIYLPSVAK